ncbi:alpha/beta fold hydrolase [Streptomyces sp. NPDC048441]|uniref:alpha/beta fold hydrolase n=1 Tax=Streptomyces sp. NPDC048441 TaxID=3365552 RepID=UPI0037144E53
MPRSVLIAEAHSPLAAPLLDLLDDPSRVWSAADDDGWTAGGLWFVAGTEGCCAAPVEALTAVRRTGVTEVNYVVPSGNLPGAGEERELRAACARESLPLRVFLVPTLLGAAAPRRSPAPERSRDRGGLLGFLDVLHALLLETAERDPDHFARVPLGLLDPPDAQVRPVAAERAAALMTAVARRPDTFAARHFVGPVSPSTAGELTRLIGEVYGVRLEHTHDTGAQDPLSRRLADRLAMLAPYSSEKPAADYLRTHELAGLDPEETALDEVGLRTRLSVVAREQLASTRAARDRAPRVWSTLRESVCASAGAPFTFHEAGDTTSKTAPLVLLNALGQGLDFWERLIEALGADHRIVIWEPRGHVEAPGLADHARDLCAVLDTAGIDSCHLVGWCTGPKLALEFHRRRPGVARSMVFLNGSFRLTDAEPDLDTAYERNLGHLSRTVSQHPESAGMLMRMFTSQDGTTQDGTSQDATEPTADVLSGASPLLDRAVRRPFADEQRLISYASQLADFWRQDALRDAEQVHVPLLFIGAERDDIVSPERFRRAASRFPRSRYVPVSGSGHYVLFDRPELIAQLIRDFVRT